MNIVSQRLNIPIILLIFLLGGCSKTIFEWNEGRTTGGILAIVNDSLAIQRSYRCWSKTTTGFLSDDEDAGCSRPGMYLVNYRTKQSPIWGDSAIDDFGFFSAESQVGDSTVLILSKDHDKIGFWKIGRKPSSLKKMVWSAQSCTPQSQDFANVAFLRVHQWSEGKLIMLKNPIPDGGDSCQYATLDTITGQIMQSRFADSDAWLSKCEDIMYSYGSVLCLRRSISHSCGLDIVVNNVVVDSLRLDSCKLQGNKNVGTWLGSYLRIDAFWKTSNWSVINRFDLIKKHEQNRFVTQYPQRWLTEFDLGFADSLNSEVRYDDNDLIISSGIEK